MARNRQRARDRKARQQGEPGEIHHEETPGGLDHLGEVEEFDASLIQGADGEPTDVDAAELEAAAGGAGRGLGAAAVGGRAGLSADEEEAPARKQASGPKPGGNRVLNFLRASWAELQ